MEVQRFADKKVLVVEDHAEMRTQLKSMLERMNLRNIDVVPNGEDAIDRLKARQYDIILCDYELGRGKDGSQVLEESRVENLLKSSTVFVMITAAQTVEMVMGALEYEPDGYIAKPVTFDNLAQRLGRILKTKAAYGEINVNVDKGRIDDAIEGCSRLIAEQPRLAMQAYRIKGNLLVKEKRWDQAEELFSAVIGIRKLGWALIGMAKVKFHQRKYDEARDILEGLTQQNNKYIEVYDWLAKLYEMQGQMQKAQQALREAIAQSPKAVLRQMELGRVAAANSDWATAAQSYRKSILLAKESVYKNPDNYLQLARALQDVLMNGSPRDKRYATVEVFKVLESAKREYETDKVVHLKATLLEAESHNNTGKPKEAERCAQAAHKLYENMGREKTPQLGLEVGKILVKYGNKETGEQLVAEMERVLNEDGDSKELQVSSSTEQAKEIARKRIDVINNQAVELFEKGKLEEASQMFIKAADDPEASYGVLLNSIQALVAYLQTVGPKDEFAKACDKFLNRLNALPENDKRFERFQRLKLQFTELRPA